MSTLAIAGATPVFQSAPVRPPFPVRQEAVADTLRDVYMNGQWSFGGPHETAFCADFAGEHGAKHGIFMANGTVTLQAALIALGVGRGDEVIVPALTWVATAMAVHYVGAIPVFVDVEADTLCMDPERVEAAITPKTRAIIPVHLYGGMADLDRLLGIAERHGLRLIEDCAHMQGGKWRGRGAGSWGDIGSFSFQESKTLASGEGGICLTNDDALAERLFRIKHIGYCLGAKQGNTAAGSPPEGLVCHNFRGTEFAAVILNGQLPMLADRIDHYNRAADRIVARLADVPGVHVQARGRQASPQGYYALMVIFDGPQFTDIDLGMVTQGIQAEGFPAACGTYGPVYKHALWTLPASEYRIHGPCPVADVVAVKKTVGIAHQWLMADDATIDGIAETFARVLGQPEALRAAVTEGARV